MLKPNPYLRKLGFANHDRVVILHADDIGMCHGTVPAYADLLNFGLLSSAAMMVPCSWFLAAADCYQQHLHLPHLDVGIHLTLTSEWATYRWRPVSTADPASGLLDADGYLHARTADFHTHAQELAVERELLAQIEQAFAAGLDLTHMDSHMLTLFHPQLLPIYFRLAHTYRLPVFMLRGDSTFWQAWGFAEPSAITLAHLTQEAEASGLPLFDHFQAMSLETNPGDRLAEAKAALAACPAGLTHFIIHPALDTPELRAMAPDWPSRVEDYRLFISEAWRQAINESGVQVIGYRHLREAMRA